MAIGGYWKLDNNGTDSIGNSTMNDISGVSYSAGFSGQKAYVPDGAYIRNSSTSNNANKLVTSNGFSITCLANRSSRTSSNREWLYSIQGGGGQFIYIVITDGGDVNAGNYLTVLAGFSSGGSTRVNAKFDLSSLDTTKLHFFCITCDTSQNIQIRVDGKPVGTTGKASGTITTWTATTGEHSIGALRNASEGEWKGYIDEFKHYDTFISNGTIKNQYAFYKGFF